ncbi:hypothetical protein BC943DRAFT_331583 [Umbelopsis sp. AD052]|nr:hypothetical protein BC943DRAFT_331583 [Umbelopsis sp. AD052]
MCVVVHEFAYTSVLCGVSVCTGLNLASSKSYFEGLIYRSAFSGTIQTSITTVSIMSFE